jgi:hypothetical protein
VEVHRTGAKALDHGNTETARDRTDDLPLTSRGRCQLRQAGRSDFRTGQTATRRVAANGLKVRLPWQRAGLPEVMPDAFGRSLDYIRAVRFSLAVHAR